MRDIRRNLYLNQLNAWKNHHVIKIITGIRRCGKSTLLRQFHDELLSSGIEKDQIISINMEDLSFEPLHDFRELHRYVSERLIPDKMNYVLVDEIQSVEEFQKAIDSLFLKENVDIYLTGSNAYLLSGEIATLLSGRYVEIEMLPFSLEEFHTAFDETWEQTYRHYIATSSFPYSINLSTEEELRQYLQGVYNTVVLKDVVQRNQIQRTDILEKVIRYLCDNIGNLTSLKRISDTLASSSNKVSQHTVDTYVQGLLNCYMFYKVSRYDVHGREHLRIGDKYYISDIGLRNMLLGIRPNDFGHILENVVFLELKRRGEQVFVGRAGQQEIDFVCLRNGAASYFQVALTTRDETVLERELSPLLSVKDHYPKTLVTLDNEPKSDYLGIRKTNITDWITERS